MTDDHAMLVPLMATALVAYGVSRLVCPRRLYEALAESFHGPAPAPAPATPAVTDNSGH